MKQPCEKNKHVKGKPDGYQIIDGKKDEVYRCAKCNYRINARTGNVVK